MDESGMDVEFCSLLSSPVASPGGAPASGLHAHVPEDDIETVSSGEEYA